MFLFGKELKLVSPVSGKAVPLEDVPDEVFAQRLAGDGMAIEPSNGTFVAPCDGELAFIFKTNHAYAIRLDSGLEVLVHIGVDTVQLEGNGFKRLVEQGVKVKAGTPIIEVDLDFVKSSGYPCVTPLLITNTEVTKEIKPIFSDTVIAGSDVVIKYKLK